MEPSRLSGVTNSLSVTGRRPWRPRVPAHRSVVTPSLPICRRLVVACAAAAVALLVVPSPAEGQGFPVLVELRGDSLFAPRDFTAGTITVRLQTKGERDAALHLYRIPVGMEFEEFRAQVMASAPGHLDALAAGGPVPSRDSTRAVATMDVRQGRYLVVAATPGSAGFPRQKSRYTMSTAVMKSAVLQPTAFIVDGTVTLSDRELRVSNTIRAGWRRVRVRNDGPGQHGVQVVRLRQGRTRADVTAWLRSPKGERPFDWTGGASPMTKERDTWLDLDLNEKGDYLLLCPVRGKDGRLHADGGEWGTLKVH